jgi:hypothetical protein
MSRRAPGRDPGRVPNFQRSVESAWVRNVGVWGNPKKPFCPPLSGVYQGPALARGGQGFHL